jgi:hypothetical protein
VAEEEVAVAVRGLGVGRDDEVRAEVEGPLAEGRHGGVVDDDEGADAASALRHQRQVAHVEPRVRGGLDPHQAVAAEAALREGGGGA